MLEFSPIKMTHIINLEDTIIILLLTKDMIVSGHNNSCSGTNVPGHKLNVSGHKRVWAQSCLGTIVSGHKRV